MATVKTPPNAGAQNVGLDTCTTCHRSKGQDYRAGTHGAGVTGANACETCHGPGSLHVEGGGDKTKIMKGHTLKR